jgi:hypothetical protein
MAEFSSSCSELSAFVVMGKCPVGPTVGAPAPAAAANDDIASVNDTAGSDNDGGAAPDCSGGSDSDSEDGVVGNGGNE